MRGTELTDAALCRAVDEMAAGLVDASLGGGVLKKRIGVAGRGKRGGTRTIVVHNLGDHWFFVYGFEKNERSNVSDAELEQLKELAKDLSGKSDEELQVATKSGALVEVDCGAFEKEDEGGKKDKK